MELLYYFKQGGWVMYPLLLLSILSFAIFIERMMYYRSVDMSSKDFEYLLRYIKQKETDSIHALENEHASDMVVLASQYFASSDDLCDKEKALESEVNFKDFLYNENLEFLSMIVTMAPLLGLLGTIFGIVSAFRIFDSQDKMNQFAITGGIGEALIATAFGLIVAIFTLGLYAFLKYYIAQLNKKMAQCCVQLLAGRDQ